MKMEIWAVGKFKNRELSKEINHYLDRMRKYQAVQLKELTIRTKSTDPSFLKKTEGEKILSGISEGDFLILMDEKGEQLSSRKFASFLQELLMSPVNRLIVLIGGAYGFDEAVYDRSQKRLSLSSMTFPHDLARLITVEQLYRAFSILNHSPYHH